MSPAENDSTSPRAATTRRGLVRAAVGAVLAIAGSAGAVALAAQPARAPVRILLLGDSTVEGSICRKAEPDADHLESILRKRLAAEPGVPAVEVVNQGRDGEYIQRLLEQRYDREIKPLGRFDVVLIRYGINDRARREGFPEAFVADYRALVARLRRDHPGAMILLETTIPYANPDAEKSINDRVREVAELERLPVIDIHAAFARALERSGPQALTYRRVDLDAVPERLRPLIPPAALSVVRNQVVVMDQRVDAHFREVPRWFADRHPNLAGYHEIAEALALELAPRLRGK
ncbi:MAG: SGNH/GDSL hydrolase family protein [Isosphaeraceae bacterium]|nr:SGNH/GDSL hydrolase family protein [Isosphaeraceae bacterium]